MPKDDVELAASLVSGSDSDGDKAADRRGSGRRGSGPAGSSAKADKMSPLEITDRDDGVARQASKPARKSLLVAAAGAASAAALVAARRASRAVGSSSSLPVPAAAEATSCPGKKRVWCGISFGVIGGIFILVVMYQKYWAQARSDARGEFPLWGKYKDTPRLFPEVPIVGDEHKFSMRVYELASPHDGTWGVEVLKDGLKLTWKDAIPAMAQKVNGVNPFGLNDLLVQFFDKGLKERGLTEMFWWCRPFSSLDGPVEFVVVPTPSGFWRGSADFETVKAYVDGEPEGADTGSFVTPENVGVTIPMPPPLKDRGDMSDYQHFGRFFQSETVPKQKKLAMFEALGRNLCWFVDSDLDCPRSKTQPPALDRGDGTVVPQNTIWIYTFGRVVPWLMFRIDDKMSHVDHNPYMKAPQFPRWGFSKDAPRPFPEVPNGKDNRFSMRVYQLYTPRDGTWGAPPWGVEVLKDGLKLRWKDAIPAMAQSVHGVGPAGLNDLLVRFFDEGLKERGLTKIWWWCRPFISTDEPVEFVLVPTPPEYLNGQAVEASLEAAVDQAPEGAETVSFLSLDGTTDLTSPMPPPLELQNCGASCVRKEGGDMSDYHDFGRFFQSETVPKRKKLAMFEALGRKLCWRLVDPVASGVDCPKSLTKPGPVERGLRIGNPIWIKTLALEPNWLKFRIENDMNYGSELHPYILYAPQSIP